MSPDNARRCKPAGWLGSMASSSRATWSSGPRAEDVPVPVEELEVHVRCSDCLRMTGRKEIAVSTVRTTTRFAKGKGKGVAKAVGQWSNSPQGRGST